MTVVLFEPHLDDAVLLRFLDRICIGDADQCWEWTGAKGEYGYKRLAREFAVDEKTIRRIISGRTWA